MSKKDIVIEREKEKLTSISDNIEEVDHDFIGRKEQLFKLILSERDNMILTK